MRPFRAARVADDSSAGSCDKDIFSSAEDGTFGVCAIISFTRRKPAGFRGAHAFQAKTEFCIVRCTKGQFSWSVEVVAAVFREQILEKKLWFSLRSCFTVVVSVF